MGIWGFGDMGTWGYGDMGNFTQPQQKYAGTGENCNIASAVIFYSGIKLYENSCASNLGV